MGKDDFTVAKYNLTLSWKTFLEDSQIGQIMSYLGL